jgi:NAD-dependent deacetylase
MWLVMRVVFLTGAGLSAESGLPTFRGPEGLYEGMRAEEILSSDGYRRDPAFVENFMAQRREAMLKAAPNAAHMAIASYANSHPGTVVLTQNIDNLLERAGCPDVIHLHGEIMWLRCLGRSHRTPATVPHTARCEKCQSRLRSDVVLFGETAPAYSVLRSALASQTEDDALVVVGTQGGVIPIGRVLHLISGKKILINAHPSEHLPESLFDSVHIMPATQGLPLALESLQNAEPSLRPPTSRKRSAMLWKELRGRKP